MPIEGDAFGTSADQLEVLLLLHTLATVKLYLVGMKPNIIFLAEQRLMKLGLEAIDSGISPSGTFIPTPRSYQAP